VDLGCVGLQRRRLGADSDGVVHGPDLEGDVDTGDAVDVYRDLGLLEVLESLLAGFENVNTRRQVCEVVTTRRIGNPLTGQAGVFIGDDDGGPRDESA
jgi:hypothetical protein